MSDMEIRDIQPSSNLTLMATRGNKRIEIPVKMAELTPAEEMAVRAYVQCEFLPLNVVTHQYKEKIAIISFKSLKADLSLLVLHGPDIYKWDNVDVDMVALKSGKRIHVLKFKESTGEKFNRRRGIRLDLDKRMDIQQQQGLYSVIVKDVSYCGFGFVDKGKSNIDPDTPVTLNLVDNYDRPFGFVGGLIVRVKELDDGDVLYGCKVGKDFQGILQKYIAIQQMERVRGHSVKDLIKNEDHGEWKQSIVYQMKKKL